MASEQPSSKGAFQETSATKCMGVNCSNDVKTLRCPTCIKMGKTSYFCSQDCVKNSWVPALTFWLSGYTIANRQESHKAFHKRPNYLLEIRLSSSDISNPPITRTISCPANATFQSLHHAIQIAFGWSTTHTYDFVIKDPSYNPEDHEMDIMSFIKRRI